MKKKPEVYVGKVDYKERLKNTSRLIVRRRSLWTTIADIKEPHCEFKRGRHVWRVLQANKNQDYENRRGFIEWLVAVRDDVNGGWDVMMKKVALRRCKDLQDVFHSRLMAENMDIERRKRA